MSKKLSCFIFLFISLVMASLYAAEAVKLTPEQLDSYPKVSRAENSLDSPPLETQIPSHKTPSLPQAIVNSGLYPTVYEQKLADALWNTADKAGSIAKSVSHGIGDYVRERQIDRKQQEIVSRFYAKLEALSASLNLTFLEKKELISKVEQIYVQDGETDQYHLDTLQFRELPQIIKKEYSEILLSKTQNGTVDVYDLKGKIKSKWEMKDAKPHGAVITYYENGDILYIDLYEQGRKISRKKYDQEGKLEFEQNYDYELSNNRSQETKNRIQETDDKSNSLTSVL